MMEDPSFFGGHDKIEIAGYSLGGTHAQRFLADHWKKVSQAVFFNDPSVNSSLADRFADQVNRAPLTGERQLSISIYRTKNDVAHCVGEKHIGCGVTHPEVAIEVVDLDHAVRQQLSRIDLHAQRFFDRIKQQFIASRYENSELNSQLDNFKRHPDVFWWESLRNRSRHFLYPIFLAIHKVSRCMSRYLGMSPFRYSQR